MASDDGVTQAIAGLAADREHGATDLALASLDILRRAAAGADRQPLGDGFTAAAEQIVLTRPAMAAIKNAVARVLASAPLPDCETARRAIDHVEAWLRDASRAAAHAVASLLPNGATIVTCSYSRTVAQGCDVAACRGKHLRVVALASDAAGVPYGERMAATLRRAGVAVEVRPDDVDLEPLGVTLALTGADRVMPDGSFVNGSPTLALARRIQGVAPLSVAAESFKLDDGTQVEEGFDCIPSGLVARYVTDRGVARPAEVWALRRST
jgi:translation initiation factor 2B subunit (eIF-2B alpha/beta/delta family)